MFCKALEPQKGNLLGSVASSRDTVLPLSSSAAFPACSPQASEVRGQVLTRGAVGLRHSGLFCPKEPSLGHQALDSSYSTPGSVIVVLLGTAPFHLLARKSGGSSAYMTVACQGRGSLLAVLPLPHFTNGGARSSARVLAHWSLPWPGLLPEDGLMSHGGPHVGTE